MGIAIIVPDRDMQGLQRALQHRIPDLDGVWIYPDIPDYSLIEMAVVWKHPAGSLSSFPNLKGIQSFGAGVEHLLNDPDLPSGVPMARVVQRAMTVSMRHYVGMAVLAIHKRMDYYRRNQAEGIWRIPDPVELEVRIGILGMGVLGEASARFLAEMGFEVRGYSRSTKEIPGVYCCNSEKMSLSEFVRGVNVLVCLLPLTPDTEGILNYALFKEMPEGSYLINAARGGHLVEDDLLRALSEGQLAGAYLDVFREEPLPVAHPFWGHPGVVITPHSSSVTNVEEAIDVVVENWRRTQEGMPLQYAVSKEKGY